MSITKLILILVIVFVIFGAGKLPQMMGDIGKGIKALKDGMQDGAKKQDAAKQLESDDKDKKA